VKAEEPVDPIKADFRNFMFVCWKQLNLPEPTPVQYDIAQYLQHGPKRAIIQAFRGVGKSWITSAYVLWLLYCDPQKKIMVVSASKTRADDFSTFCQRLIQEMPLLQHLRPRPGQRDSKISFEVGPATADHSPSVKSVGITGQLTGSRADVIVADDIEVPANSITQMMRDKLSVLVTEFDAVLKPLQTSRIIYLGTPQTEMTLYAALQNRGYKCRIWPARYPNEAALPGYGSTLAPMILKALDGDPTLASQCSGRGAPTDPARFSDLDLLERANSYGRSGFAMQFQLAPGLADADRYPLKVADLMVLDCDPFLGPIQAVWGSSPELERKDLPLVALMGDRLYRPMWVSKENYVPYTGVIMAIDPSGRGGDELGYAIVAMLNGYLFILRCKGLKGGYQDTNLKVLAEEAKRFKVNEIIIESNFGDGMFMALLLPHLQRIHPCAVEEVRSSIQKEKRIIDTLEPTMNQHRLIMDSSVIKEDFENTNEYAGEMAPKYQLMYQMTRITKDKGALSKDDRLDALAIAVARWAEVMDKDQLHIEQTHKEALRDQEVQKFLEAAGVINANRFGVMGEFFGGGDLMGIEMGI
jgi:hypothetical protein